MALTLASRSSGASLLPEKQLNEAVVDFQGVLTEEQKSALRQIKNIPDADAVLVFTAQLDSNQQRRGRSIGTRLHSVLQSVREFSAVIDTFVSSNPEIAALIWGSVKLTIQIALNFTSYFEAFSNLFMDFASHCPRFAEYQILYPSSVRLQAALCNFHASLIRCCKHAVEAAQRPWKTQLLNALWQSFEQEFKSDISTIQKCGDEVREEIALAKARADFQDQELQKKEREAASGSRRKFRDMLSRTGNDLETIKEWQLQQEKRQSGERRRQLLESLSSHDHLPPFKRACKERHFNTTQWAFETAEFCRWKDGTSPWIWCSGKIGSGKTILVASAVSHVLAHKDSPAETVTFFFPQFSDPQSLCAETVIRSIIRQSLDPVTLSEEMEARLMELDQKPSTGLAELTALLQQRLALSERFFIFIDALDEFEPRERRALLDLLKSLGSSESRLRIFLAGRDSLSGELKGRLPSIERLSMASAEAKTDIALYVKEALQERIGSRDLVVGDQTLISDIEQALTKHADGMFLWVAFLVDELCAQHCDDDIRKSLGYLPKTLTETFNRALLRIVSRRKTSVAVKTFSWVAIAKRSLTLDELREALSIHIGQPYSMPERLVNGIDQLASWCENLVHVDEELKTVQFAHQVIHKFITEGPTGAQLESFRFNLPDADHHAGEICVTYLNFNDFKTTLARRPQPMKPVDPVAMAKIALSHQPKLPSAIPAFGLRLQRQKSKAQVDVVGVLSTYEREDGEESMRKLQQSHPFLQYASVHWVSHTSRFQRTSKTWNSWHRMITSGHVLAKTPWSEQREFDVSDPEVPTWALQSRHYALIRLLDAHGAISTQQREDKLMSAAQGDIELLDALLEGGCSPAILEMSLRNASKAGRLEVVERLIAAGANVNAYLDINVLQALSRDGPLEVAERLLASGADVNASVYLSGGTALQQASEGGYLEVVELLLASGADVNAHAAAGLSGGTALQQASRRGYLEIVERLLEAGADVNVAPAGRGRTALQAACEGGYLEVVERLLMAGADVNASPSLDDGRTALQAAVDGGHLEIVECLLAAGADVNIEASRDRGWTAIQAASAIGDLDVIERLLRAGADVNAVPSRRGRTALQAASEGGFFEVVERLLAAGADVNADAAELSGRTALQAASERGYFAVVERLLAAGANVNADGAKVCGRTALGAASERHHFQIVERLLAAGATGVCIRSAVPANRAAAQGTSDYGHFAQRRQDRLGKPTHKPNYRQGRLRY